MKQTKDQEQTKGSSMMAVTEEMKKKKKQASEHSEAGSCSLSLLQNIVYKQGPFPLGPGRAERSSVGAQT